MELKLRGRMLGRETSSDVVVRDGKVISITPSGRARVDAGSRSAIFAPTLFDMQVNGAFGVDLQSPDLTVADVCNLTRLLAAQGVSCWMPTLITGALDSMEHGCRVIAEAVTDREAGRAIAGIHLEGPFISPKDGPRGAHALAHVRKPSLHEFDRLQKAAEGQIRCVTTAPELEGAIPFIKGLVSRGVIVSLGHHNASAEQITRAVDAGARLSTHLGNGLGSMIHRHLNPLWPQLAEDRLTAGLIADLEHLPAEALQTFIRAKGPERVILTSDCVHIAGLPAGKYKLGAMNVELMPSGRVCLIGTDFLAGSSLMLLQGVINAAEKTHMTLEEAFESASTIPARLFGVKHRFAPPKAGARADFILFEIDRNAQGNATAVLQSVFVDGARKM